MYPIELVKPMAADLTDFGFQGLSTAGEVDQIFENPEGTFVLVVNSVCGCAAANARPGVKLALQNDKKPNRIVNTDVAKTMARIEEIIYFVYREAQSQAVDFHNLAAASRYKIEEYFHHH